MQKEQLYRALDVCIQSIQAGQDLDRVLDMYLKWRNELAPLIRSAFVAYQLGLSVSVPQEEFEVERQKFQQASQMVIPEVYMQSRPSRWRGIVLIFLVVMILSLVIGGLVVLSNRAFPGSIFYEVKEFRRDLHLSSLKGSQEYIQTRLQFDEERLLEIQSLAEMGREAPVSFGGRISQGENGEWLVNDLLLITNRETELVGDIWPGYYVRIEGYLLKDGQILAKRIQIQQFLVRGIVESLTAERLVVDGIEILLAPDTLLQGEISLGARVDIMTLLAGEGLFRARLIKVINSEEISP